MTLEKPFNPVIGETFQVKANNTLYYAEQTSHHPPIYNFYMKNPKFKIYGHCFMEAKLIPDKAFITNGGKYTLEYNDGVKYQIIIPNSFMDGIVLGARYCAFVDFMKIEDLVTFL